MCKLQIIHANFRRKTSRKIEIENATHARKILAKFLANYIVSPAVSPFTLSIFFSKALYIKKIKRLRLTFTYKSINQ